MKIFEVSMLDPKNSSETYKVFQYYLKRNIFKFFLGKAKGKAKRKIRRKLRRLKI